MTTLGIIRRLLGPDPPLDGRSALIVRVVTITTILVVSWLDYLTGPQLSVELLYLVPVAVGALCLGRNTGLWLTALSALCWLGADVVLPAHHVERSIIVWNLVIRSSIFCLIVLLLAALKQARADAEASGRRSREFLAMAAHQLRMPITGLRAAAEATALRGAGPIDEGLLAHVVNEAARAGDLIGSMLKMARLDSGQSSAQEPFDIVDTCAAQVERWRRMRPDLRVTVTNSRPEFTVVASKEAVADAIGNLLDNAARHAAQTIGISICANDRDVVIIVTDDGPGLPAGAESRAFERFVSLDGKGGAGLGLAIARSLVESQQGSLRWDGASFVLCLPLVRAASPSRKHVRLQGPSEL